jgi:hypothetical protein
MFKKIENFDVAMVEIAKKSPALATQYLVCLSYLRNVLKYNVDDLLMQEMIVMHINDTPHLHHWAKFVDDSEVVVNDVDWCMKPEDYTPLRS